MAPVRRRAYDKADEARTPGGCRVQHATFTLTNAVGLHARPAAKFVQTAARFASAITVRNVTRGGAPADGKGILGVLTLGAEHGHVIEVSAAGPDETESLAAIRALVESNFGEAA
jgi:phosphotransferase system HPr (HPr) family protein